MVNEVSTSPAHKYFASAGRDIKAELRRSQPAFALKRFGAVRPAIHPCSKLQSIPAKANKNPPTKAGGIQRCRYSVICFLSSYILRGKDPSKCNEHPRVIHKILQFICHKHKRNYCFHYNTLSYIIGIHRELCINCNT